MSDPWTPAVHDASHGLAAWATGNRCTGLEVYARPRKSCFGSFTTGMTHTLLRRHPLARAVTCLGGPAGEMRLVGGTYDGKVDIGEDDAAALNPAFLDRRAGNDGTQLWMAVF